ncbi:MAG: hypothetical protein GJ676_04075 [Rhodobacteraceae bacterium]|nr:hypothetical protein [Paracoccaceae bacterium]
MPVYSLTNGLLLKTAFSGNNDIVVEAAPTANLHLVTKNNVDSLSYTLDPLGNGQPGHERTVTFSVNALELRLNGEKIVINGPDWDTRVMTIGWTDAGNVARTSTLLLLESDGLINDPVHGSVRYESIFVIDGHPLPNITTPAQFHNFDDNQITSANAVTSGPLGPNKVIDFVDFGMTKSNAKIGTAGNDNLVGTNAANVLEGLAGDDVLDGKGGNDRLSGGDGSDRLLGGNGADYLTTGDNQGSDYVLAGHGNDTVDMSGIVEGYVHLEHHDVASKIVVNIDGNANTGSISKGKKGTTTLIDVAAPMMAGYQFDTGGLGVMGTSRADTFNVTVNDAGWMQISGLKGNDKYVIGVSTGTIRLDLNRDNPTQGVVANLSTGVIANDGHGDRDKISGPGRINELRTTMHDDNVIGSNGNDRFILMAGNDTLNGRGGDDTVRYDRGGITDGVTVNLETGIATGTWSGQAFTHTLKNIENVRGSRDDDDHITGNSSDNHLRGRGGDDTLIGGAGDDVLEGEDGNDRLIGGNGDDTIRTGSSGFDGDFVQAGRGDDTVDMFNTSSTYVTLWHDDLALGIDVAINGAANTGSIDKGPLGTTTLLALTHAMNTEGMGIYGTGKKDFFDVAVSDFGWMQIGGLAGNDTFNIRAHNGTIRLDYRADNPTSGIVANLKNGVVSNDGFGNRDTITGAGRVNEIRATMNDDRIIGSDANDRFILMAGNDTVKGGLGDDLVRYDRSGITTGVTVDLQAQSATGTWSGQAFSHKLVGIEDIRGSRDTADTIRGSNADNNFQGRGGNDLLSGRGGSDELFGEAGNDRLYGGRGHDFLSGGDGKDFLDGGSGSDTLTGGNGIDTFVFNGGGDTITDFNGDKLRLDDALWVGNLSKAQVINTYASVNGSDTVFNFGGGDVLTIDNFTNLAALQADLTII